MAFHQLRAEFTEPGIQVFVLGGGVESDEDAGWRVPVCRGQVGVKKRNDAFRDLFHRFDYVLAPCMAVTPFPVEQNYPNAIAGRPMQTYVDWIAPTFVLSLTALPVASVPCGLDGERMPVGLQVVGRPSDEESVLALAAVVQQANPIGLPPRPEAAGKR